MNPEALIIAKASEDVLPAALEFAKAVEDSRLGSLIAEILRENVLYRWAPVRARLLMRAAEGVRRSGLPRDAVDDRLLVSVLEHGGGESDSSMQDRWSALLANRATGMAVPPSYVDILRQLEPVEARFLDALFDADEICVLGDIPGWRELKPRHLYNMHRECVLVHDGHFLPYAMSDRPHPGTNVDMTPLGACFVLACRMPNASMAADQVYS